MKRRILFFLPVFLIGAFLSITFFDQKIINAVNSVLKLNLNSEFWCLGLQHFGIELMVAGSILSSGIYFEGKNKFILYISSVIVVFFVFLFQNAVNIPITDDYKALLDFSNKYFFLPGTKEKISLLFSFYDESRIIVIRSVMVFLHFITGEVNLKTLILIGNCSLPIILFLFYKTLSKEKFRWEIILILALLLFHFGYYDATVWVIPAVHYQLIILLLMLSLFFAGNSSVLWQVSAIVCSILAALTVGNGLLVFPVVLLYFFINRKWKLLLIWAIAGIILMLFYFNDSPFLKQGITYSSVVDYFIFSCCFLGSAFQFLYKTQLPFMVGLLIWILFAILTIKKYYRNNFVIYGLILFVIASSLLAARFRLNGEGLHEAISNRYGFYSIMVFCASILAVFEIINEEKQKIFIPILLFFSIAYHLLTGIFFFPEMPIRKQKLEKFIEELKNKKPFQPIYPIIPPNANIIVKEAMEKDIYVP